MEDEKDEDFDEDSSLTKENEEPLEDTETEEGISTTNPEHSQLKGEIGGPIEEDASEIEELENHKHHHQNHQKYEDNLAPKKDMSVNEWLRMAGWNANPFILNINPTLRVGYRKQTERILMALEERHKFLLVLGPTGSGKTTLLKWLESKLKGREILFIGKPPAHPDEFVKIFTKKYRRPWYAFWQSRLDSVYQLPDFLNMKLKKKHLVLMLDEAQEASTEVLEWLRVLNDQIENMSVVLSGLPVFENQLRSNLETFAKRITARAELLSLTKEETRELISKRIRNAGGRGNEFDHISDAIYSYTGGFPREVIRICDEIVNSAIIRGTVHFEFHPQHMGEARETRYQEDRSIPLVEKMTPMQKEILEALSKKSMTPGQIANTLELEKYKSRQHAVRSVNNVMKAMFEEGLLERRKEEKAFVYSLAPRISTLFVKR